MLTLLTSCGRHDLLKKTLDSFFNEPIFPVIDLIIHEDADIPVPDFLNDYRGKYKSLVMAPAGGNGQHKSIELFLNSKHEGHKYYLHLEDDWHFNQSYDWIMESVRIMEADPSIIKVLCRRDSPHPCVHNRAIKGAQPSGNTGLFGYLEPWTSNDGILWHGFSWNPGVTRLDLLRKFVPLPKWEQDLAKEIYYAGYNVVEMAPSIYEHIGDGRSTHE